MSLQGKVRRQATRSRWRRRLVFAGLALALLLVAGAVGLRIRLHGAKLGSFVSGTINEQIRGSVTIASIDWSTSSLPSALARGWLPVEATDIVVTDDKGEILLRAPHATAEIDAHALAFGPEFRFRDIVVQGGYALIKETKARNGEVTLVQAFRPKSRPTLGAGITPSRGLVFDLQSLEVRDVALDFDFGSVFRAKAKHVTGSGWLYSDARDPLAPSLLYSLSPTAEEAHVETESLAFDVRDLQVSRLAQVKGPSQTAAFTPDLRWSAEGVTTDGAKISFQGGMLDDWGSRHGGSYDITLRALQAGELMRSMTAGVGAGKDLIIEIAVKGPRAAPRVTLDVADLQLVPSLAEKPVPINVARASAHLDLADDSGSLEDTVAHIGGGELHARASFGIRPTSFDINVDIPKAIDIEEFLPAQLVRLVGSPTLQGSARATGSPDVQEFQDIDLSLGRLSATGRLYRREDVVQVQRVGLSMGLSTVDVSGSIYSEDGIYDLSVRGASGDLSRWLRLLGMAPVATSANGTAHVTGTFENPTVTAGLKLGGVPIVDKATTRLSYRSGDLRISKVSSTALGGEIEGNAHLRLSGSPRIVSAQAKGNDVDLSKMPHVGHLFTGRSNWNLNASGALAQPVAKLQVDLRDWLFAGERYDDAEIVVRSEKGGTRALETHLSRELGGKLDLAVSMDRRDRLGGIVSMRRLPLETLTAIQSQKAPEFGAALDAEVQLAGTLARPSADGYVSLIGAWFGKSFLGRASVDLVARPDGRLGFSGRFFQDSLVVEGAISTAAPFDVEVEADVRRVEIDRFWPDLHDEIGARGWISGKVAWRGPLIPTKGSEPTMDLALTEAMLIIDSENAQGRPAPVRLRNRTPLSVSVVGDRFQLKDKVIVEGPAGDFALSGGGSLKSLDLAVEGAVSVKMLEPYFRTQFDALDGQLTAKARVRGTIADPQLTGSVSVRDISLKPAGQDAIVMVPAGKVEFTNDQLSVTGLSMVVADEFSAEKTELTISGGVKLANFEPRIWSIQIDGQLAGTMLLVVAPEIFSAASGVADLSIVLFGSGLTPDIDGRIEFNNQNPLTLVPRGLRRELTVTQGALAFTEQVVEVDNVRGWFDDEGRITDMTGEVDLEDWRPTEFDLTVSATDVPFRVPQELELAVNVRDVHIEGRIDDRIRIEGDLEIVDGRYIQKWKQAIDFLKPARSVETGPSILETEPLLANAELNLRVSSSALFVKNNVANLELSGDLTITGTPARPRLDGLVRVEHGTFRLQMVRPTFNRTSGTLWFSPQKNFPEQTPVLGVRSESDYRDTTGQNHLIILELNGPLSNLQWDLKTGAGLNKAETLNLTFLGRSITDTRAAVFGDNPVGQVGEFSGVRSTAAIEGGSLVLADEVAKTFTGDLLSSLAAEPISNLTNIDIVRLRLGATGSFNLYLEEDFTRSLRAIGEYERSSKGSTRTLRGQYRVTDRLSADYELLQKLFDDDAQVDIRRQRFKFTYRLPIIP